jgi:RND superfamily putative drug exporter
MLVLLLAVVTDYSLFYLFAVRRRLAGGMDRRRAATEAARGTNSIVAAAGAVVALGTAALLVGRLEFFRAFGPAAAGSVVIGMAVSMTLVPAALAIFGRAVFWPGLGRRIEDEGRGPRPFRRSRIVAALLAALGLTALAVPASRAFDTQLGLGLIRGLDSDTEVRRAADEAGRGFAPGIVAPTEILVEGPGVGDDRAALVRLQRLVEEQPGVAGVLGPAEVPAGAAVNVFVAADRDAARFVVVLAGAPLAAPAIESARRLAVALPRLARRAGLAPAEARLAGDTALAEETVSRIVDDIRRIGAAAIVVNIVLLAIFLRAVVPALYLVATSLLSFLAAVGLTAVVFQDGLGQLDVTYYVPFAAAVLLLSLGSDYNLFVVGRIWQYARERPLRDAVALAMAHTSWPVGVAAVVLAASFGLLALVPLRSFREFAFLMASGVVLDAFLVRLLLVPSLVLLAGRLNWWPRRRTRLSLRGR